MRISQFYNLGRTQEEMDFIDVDIYNDTRVFVDPRALRLLRSTWAHECISLIQDFFEHVLNSIKEGENQKALRLLSDLSEPNETRLGLSLSKARGRGIGYFSAKDLFSALQKSDAVKSGLLSDLEETILFIPGIGNDLISDMTTNIIRAPLIEYTQGMCELYGIPTSQVDSGPLWNPSEGQWYNQYEQLPVAKNNKLIFVPKIIVRQKSDYDAGEYFQHYVLTYLQNHERKVKSELVHLLRNGNLSVTKKDLIAKYGIGKKVATEMTQKFPEILATYKQYKNTNVHAPLNHKDLASVTKSQVPDWDGLTNDLLSIPYGKNAAHIYENLIERLLTAVFYPSGLTW